MKKARVEEERARKAEIRSKKAEQTRKRKGAKHPVVQLLVESHQHLQHPLGQKLLPSTDLCQPKHLKIRLTSMFVVLVLLGMKMTFWLALVQSGSLVHVGGGRLCRILCARQCRK